MDIFSDKLLVNLRILSKIPKNGRITRSSDGVISLESPGYLISVKRFLTADSRKQTLIEIDKILSSCTTKIKEIMMLPSSEQKSKLLELIYTELQNSTIGIENLKTTYQDDQSMVSHLDIFLLKINNIINEPVSVPETRIEIPL